MKCKCGKQLGNHTFTAPSQTKYYQFGLIQKNEEAPTCNSVDQPICYVCIENKKIQNWLKEKNELQN